MISYPNFEQSPYTNVYVIGEPLNILRLLHYTGVDPQTGLYSYEDKNSDGIVSRGTSGESEDDYAVNLIPNFKAERVST